MKEALAFIEHFKATPYWVTMKNTVEGSHWHREANVAVHTEMTIDQYLKHHAGKISDTDDKVALIALLFHDVGKPQAEQTVTKEETGETYRKYSGHEQDSSVAFSECYVRIPELRALLTPAEARAVRWIIEHHLPYQYKDKEKRRALAVGTSEALRHANVSYETFFNCVWSDASGRISDDHPKKMQDVADWTAEFKTIDVTPDAAPTGETCYLLIGPSGSGKTTWRDQMDDLVGGIHHVFVTSRDDMTLEYYFQSKKWTSGAKDPKDVYAAAWDYANMDNPKGFDSFFQKSVRKQFERAKEWRAPVVVDVVNASKKRRAHYVNEARRAGMRVVAVEFWNTLETLLKRQGTRGDKSVPSSSVRQQLYAMNCGWIGTEVDNAYVMVGQ
jgi:hypothetical protein